MKHLVMGLCMATATAAAAAAPAAKTPKAPASFEGLVERVYDGDTLRVAPDDGSEPIEIDLYGIDAPELCQPGGPEARIFLTEWLIGRKVGVVSLRTQPRVWVDEQEVNRRLVEEGHAWSVRTKWDRGPYVAQERLAKALRRGLHRAGGAAETPKDFRQRHGPCR